MKIRRAALIVAATALLYSATSGASPAPDLPTTTARITCTGIDAVVTYVSGIGSNNAVTTGTAKAVPTHTPGKLDFLSLVVSRPQADQTFLQWRQAVLAGSGYKRTLTVELLDNTLHPVATYSLLNAWPSSYAVSQIQRTSVGKVGATEQQETLTIAYENLTRSQ